MELQKTVNIFFFSASDLHGKAAVSIILEQMNAIKNMWNSLFQGKISMFTILLEFESISR